MGDAKLPTFYLAIPPDMFGTVVEQLGKSGCSDNGARDRGKAVRPRL